MHVTLRHPHW